MFTSAKLFDTLDAWRHLPSYQLERRADVFLALYLPAFLRHHFGLSSPPHLIPEFPIHLGTICEGGTNQSCKVDYLAITEDHSDAFLIELKTDGNSRRPEQDAYLRAAQDKGLCRLLRGIITICRATNDRHKYLALLQLLERDRLLTLPQSLQEITGCRPMPTFVQELDKVQITAGLPALRIDYIQPQPGDNAITLGEIANWMGCQYKDSFSTRFCESLRTWSDNPAVLQ